MIESDLFNFTELLEHLFDLLLLPGLREVLNEKIASLFGGLVSNSFPLFFSISFELTQSASNDELVAVDLLLVETLNSLGGTSGTVLLGLSLRIVVANESKSTELRLLEEHGLDGTIGLEELSDLLIRHVAGEVLDVDVVDELSHGGLIVSWLEHEALDTLRKLVSLSGSESSGGGLSFLEADEAVSIGFVLRSHGNLEGLDGTELLHNFVEIFVKDVSGNLDENVVSKKLLLVGTEELLVEGKTSAWLTGDLEISHLVTSLLVLIGILNVYHSGVERLGDVLLNLRLLLGVRKDDVGDILESSSDLDGGHVFLGKIIQIHELLVSSLSVECHCSVFFFDLRNKV